MSTLHRFAEAAIQRDLHRARVVLCAGTRFTADRREALTDHLAWMSGLVDSPDPRVTEAAGRLFAAAFDFHGEGDRGRRVELLGAVESLIRVTRGRDTWTSAEALWGLGEHIPWLLDGVAMPQGAGLVLREPGGGERGRLRAAAYRRARAHLWGTVSLSRPVSLRGERVTTS